MAARGRAFTRVGRGAVTTGNSWSDAWFLAAAHGAGQRRARLTDILGESDYINHAILTPAEIDHAVRRLVSGGLLAIENPDTFRVTSAGRTLVQRAQRGLRFWPEILDRLVIAVDAAVPASAAEQDPGWALDRRLYEAASAEYATRFDAEVRRFEGLPSLLRGLLLVLLAVMIRLWQAIRR